MFKSLLLVFIIIPIIEIALLIQVSEVIGGWSTITLVIVTAFIGAKLVKQQGTDALKNVQTQMAKGQMPAKDLFSGLCVIIAGVLLVTPGIVTDIFGFLLLTPLVRNKMAAGILKQVATKSVSSGAHGFHFSSGSFGKNTFNQDHNQQSEQGQVYENEAEKQKPKVLEGEFQRKE
ncbi:F exclusion suppressor [Pseudoalteromonas sp. NBT06-2]|uniref:FxsA family protein n=1 Tax=Pseudoalteromonas sp. NBT06-2 TaxID=2025950 RepID=UPI000BA6DD26|nr:FxsA family protein [Pseudoalteromonas sp. NBT06-2]PAJ76090.1 F exclusion suppressor [Pseudoalteromonas sp. NBT06-2]